MLKGISGIALICTQKKWQWMGGKNVKKLTRLQTEKHLQDTQSAQTKSNVKGNIGGVLQVLKVMRHNLAQTFLLSSQNWFKMASSQTVNCLQSSQYPALHAHGLDTQSPDINDHNQPPPVGAFDLSLLEVTSSKDPLHLMQSGQGVMLNAGGLRYTLFAVCDLIKNTYQ